jgi:hypothetical protein
VGCTEDPASNFHPSLRFVDNASMMDQVIYIYRLFYKTLKYYCHLQRYWKQKLFTKVIKMPSLNAWVKRPTGLIKRGTQHKAFKRVYLDSGRECFI